MPVDRRLITLTAEDGEVHDALFEIDERAARARTRATGRRTALVHIHGIMGNFLVGTLRFYPAPLARAGFPVLVLETRMANVGQLFGQAIFEQAIKDVDAAVVWLRSQGFDTIVLSGYSSGATLATRYAATRHLPDLRGLVCLGNPWGLPQSMQRRAERYGATPDYGELIETIRRAIGANPDDPAEDRLFVVERSRGPTTSPADSEVYTYRTWWHSRGPAATSAMAFRQIGQVWAPILLVQGTDDEVVYFEEAVALARVARQAGNPDVTIMRIDGAGHAFRGAEIPTLDAVISWLRRRA
ncbi:alpha/beta hydrolase family protein [Miltoncostaea marina]|uniref:alpha/beta hydrolase family protein n=1 Tax=Miltoncostaea marina TaxID=2843215 RepID=UPI001C3E47D0|nr:alpha/beta fold hydrolase [Miltoncostaea marina]